MVTKEDIIKAVSELSAHLSAVEILDSILYLNKTQNRAFQLDRGEGLSTEQLRNIILNG